MTRRIVLFAIPDAQILDVTGPCSWQRPGCLTAAARPPTGRPAKPWRFAIRKWRWKPTPSSFGTAASTRRPVVTAGMDLALALVEEDHGSEVALMVARRLVSSSAVGSSLHAACSRILATASGESPRAAASDPPRPCAERSCGRCVWARPSTEHASIAASDGEPRQGRNDHASHDWNAALRRSGGTRPGRALGGLQHGPAWACKM